VKRGTLDWVRITLWDNSFVSGKYAWFNLATGVAGAAPSGGTTVTYLGHSITNMGRGIYRCTLSVQTNTITDGSFQISGDTGDGAFSGTGTVLLDAAQVEVGTTPTSLIPTTSGPVSRVADALDIPLTNGTYDIFVQDTAGSEWRTGIAVSTGLYRATPRTGQDHISRVRAWIAGTLTTQERNALL
jgi:hypothetical protein